MSIATKSMTRRRVAAGAGLAFLAAAAPKRIRAAGVQDDATPAGSGARTIEHKYGTTEVPANPQRVVSVGYTDHDPLLALGVVPVGVREWLAGAAVQPWAEDELGGAEPAVLPANELNFEQIAALRPDLIVGVASGMTADDYATLAAIAPTVAAPANYVDFGVPWQEHTRLLGRALDRGSRAEEAVAAVEDRFAAVREAQPAFAGATGAFASSFAPGQYYVYGPEDARGRFLAALGFELPAEIAALAGDAFFAELSQERFDLLEVDALVWLFAIEGTRQDVEENPLFRALAVAREGRTVFVEADDPLGVALSYGTVLSLPHALDGLVPRLAAAIDGDPATAATPTA